MPIIKIGSNSKLGKTIGSFNIPSVTNCPGRTQACESVCYASKGLFRMQSQLHQKAKDHTESISFVSDVNNELSKSKLKAVRIHAAGDFYSSDYINKWTAIAKANPNIKFWAYTRSWRISDMHNALEEFNKLDNVQLFASIDDECRNETVPSWLRKADMIDDWSNSTDKSYVQCPNLKNKDITCEKCSYCFKGPTQTKKNVLFKIH